MDDKGSATNFHCGGVNFYIPTFNTFSILKIWGQSWKKILKSQTFYITFFNLDCPLFCAPSLGSVIYLHTLHCRSCQKLLQSRQRKGRYGFIYRRYGKGVVFGNRLRYMSWCRLLWVSTSRLFGSMLKQLLIMDSWMISRICLFTGGSKEYKKRCIESVWKIGKGWQRMHLHILIL